MGWTQSGIFHSDVGHPRPLKMSGPRRPTSRMGGEQRQVASRRHARRRDAVARALAHGAGEHRRERHVRPRSYGGGGERGRGAAPWRSQRARGRS